MMPSEAPPSYDAVAADKNKKKPSRQGSTIPDAERRSIEDSIRPLPTGWIRQWDPKTGHNFFVDTKATPPRSIWHHPLDDEEYVHAHSEEAKRLNAQVESASRPSYDDNTTDEEGDVHQQAQASMSRTSKPPPTGMKKLGQSMKNKMTGSTHAERVAKREQRRKQEEEAYKKHQLIRAAMMRAQQTGQPELIGKDTAGRDLFAQPPPRENPYIGASLGHTPYQQPGQYGYGYGAGPYGAPYGSYGRRGYGYGGGMGMGGPMMLGGGLLGGMMLGGLMF